VPPEHERAGDVNRRIRAGDNADEEREGEIVDGTAAKDEQAGGGDKHRTAGDDGSAQSLIERLIDDFER